MSTILAIDDKRDNLISLSALLKNLMPECLLITAQSGAEGLQRARTERPDVILLDVRMPDMDGFETCSRLMADATTRGIPVIMITAIKTDAESRIKGLEVGALTFLSKPIDPVELVSQVRVALRIREAEDALRKQADEEREVTVQLLQLLHDRNDLQDLMRAVTALLQGWIGCEAIGIRLRSGEDFPYFETSGFPPAFVEKENRLCTYDLKGQILRDDKGHPLLDCMCGNVLCGRFDPAKPFFTPRGSFWTNGTTALLATTTEADRQAPTRNRCNGEGYESVALIPLRTTDQVFGLLQINDRRPNRFTAERIALFERLTDNLAIALAQRQAQEALRKNEELYRSLFANMLNGFAYCRMLFDQGKPQDFIYLAVNESFSSLTGLQDVVGKKVSEVIPGIRELDAGLIEIYGRVALSGRPERFEWHLAAMDIWFSVSVYSPASEHFVSVFDVITDRKRAEEELQRTLASLRNAVGTTIQVMASAVETRDPYTAGHQSRSANLARAIATEMGLSQDQVDAVRLAGSIHDIGKLSIPAELLSKPTKLSPIEYDLIKEHALQGYNILRNVESPWPLADMVHQHHERMDGSGYPQQLKGEALLLEARILAVADVVESMASHRPYRAALGIEAALAEIEKNKGRLYDEPVAEACLKLFRERGFQLDIWGEKEGS